MQLPDGELIIVAWLLPAFSLLLWAALANLAMLAALPTGCPFPNWDACAAHRYALSPQRQLCNHPCFLAHHLCLMQSCRPPAFALQDHCLLATPLPVL
jgi:hypothetical protein